MSARFFRFEDPELWHHVKLDTEELVTVRWEQAKPIHWIPVTDFSDVHFRLIGEQRVDENWNQI